VTDQPWMMRTYSGHTSAEASNALYRANLAKGQTGLSVAFDLPTQTGYDPDHPLARGEVGRVGVPVPHLGELRTLFADIPIETMNTSMTINATAVWLLALYLALAEERSVDPVHLTGTVQNDIVKEYLSRGTFIFPPEPSLRLTVDLIAHTVHHVPRWNPINICSYHLQEAGATPAQEVAFALATACDVLDAVRSSGQIPDEDFPLVVGRMSFFVNAGIRFVEETCKMRAFTRVWDRITRERYGVTDEKLRRFRFGVQVNSLGLTEAQPENNVPRIVLEALGVTLSRDARARAMQLPAWNEALGLPRAWDQQWSLRIQQILAYETDLLDYPDIFAGSTVIERKTGEIEEAATVELDDVLDRGGAFANIAELKGRLVQSLAERVRRIESGEQTVVGVNRFTETEPSPLTTGVATDDSVLLIDAEAEAATMDRLLHWRNARDPGAVADAQDALLEAAESGANIIPPSLALARSGGTVGEWADTLRSAFGEYRAPTGIGGTAVAPSTDLLKVRARVRAAAEPGGPIRILIGKPGLDGHSNGAEQIAVAARDAGMEVVYQGIRLTPDQIATAARDEDVDLVGLSVLSGAHLTLVPDTLHRLRAYGLHIPLVIGGIVPDADRDRLLAAGVARVYTPRDYRIAEIMADIAELALAARSERLRPAE